MFSGVFLWLGLYLVTRDTPIHGHHNQRWWRRSASTMGVAMICEACALAGIAMQMISDEPWRMVFWARLTW